MTTLDQPQLLYPDVIARNARYFGKKTAVVCGSERRSWAEFHLRTNKVANALLGLGLKKGDKVCLLMNSSVTMFELLWGTIKAGGVTVPLNVMMSQDALPVMVNNSDAGLIFADAATVGQVDAVRSQCERLAAEGCYAVGHTGRNWKSAEDLIDSGSPKDPLVPLNMADSFNIIYSSGTTGVPKGIEHSHFARHMYPLGFGPEMQIDRYTIALCSTPLYTNGTWITMLPTVYWGGTVVLLSKFSGSAFLQAVERERCTHAFLVPTQIIVILETEGFDKYDTSSLRMLLSGGAPLPTATFDRACEKLPSAGFYECYGMTEGFITVNTPKDLAQGKRGSVGQPIFAGDIRVINPDGNEVPAGEIGEIAGYSPGLMKGYYKDRERTAEIIWRGPHGRTYLRSGDVGRMDEDGFLYVMGRTKDMIISGGINVFASDIEEVFMQHPDVYEAAAIGIPHGKWGETPLLLAIPREGAKIGEEELREWGNARLGKYQRVSKVEFRNEFPRATHDKVLKRALRDPYWEGREKKI